MTAVLPDRPVATPAPHRPRRPRWLVLTVVALLLGAIGFGAGYSVGDEDATAPPAVEGLASDELVAVIDGSLEAFNTGDMAKFASYFTDDAIFSEPGAGASNKPVQGRAEIQRIMKGLYDLGASYTRIGPVVVEDNLASFPVSGVGSVEMDVIQFDDDLKIVRYWSIY